MPAEHAPDSPLLLVREAELPALGREDTIALLAEELAARLPCAAAVLRDSALEREASEPTYLGKGMALPHARVAGLERSGICVAHAAAGITWHGEKAQLIVFLAVPEEAPELYLQLLSRLLRWRLGLPEDALDAPGIPTDTWRQQLQGILDSLA